MIIKPPVGLKPRYLHEAQRIRDICDAMERYAEARIPIPVEWVIELRDILKISKNEVTK